VKPSGRADMPTENEKNETSSHWFAVYCKPRQELVAQENLERQGFHTYLPRIQLKRRRREKWIDAIEVLFPRYLFIRVDLTKNSIAPVRSTRGAVGLVRFGSQPAIIADEVMEALSRHENAESGLHPCDQSVFSEGELVRLTEGPFVEMEGIFSQENSEKRVTVLLELLGRTSRVAVSRDWLVKAA
jgi:transcriptional antiterminator RfaH